MYRVILKRSFVWEDHEAPGSPSQRHENVADTFTVNLFTQVLVRRRKKYHVPVATTLVCLKVPRAPSQRYYCVDDKGTVSPSQRD